MKRLYRFASFNVELMNEMVKRVGGGSVPRGSGFQFWLGFDLIRISGATVNRLKMPIGSDCHQKFEQHQNGRRGRVKWRPLLVGISANINLQNCRMEF